MIAGWRSMYSPPHETSRIFLILVGSACVGKPSSIKFVPKMRQ